MAGVVAGTGAAALVLFFLTAATTSPVNNHLDLILLLVATALLQLLVVPLPQGAVSFSCAGMLALGFLFGPSWAIAGALVAALVRYAASRGLLYRALFDVANLSLAAGFASILYRGASHGRPLLVEAALALCAGALYWLINSGLLSIAMGVQEAKPPLTFLRERFGWTLPHTMFAALLAASAAGVSSEIKMPLLLLPAGVIAVLLVRRHRSS